MSDSPESIVKTVESAVEEAGKFSAEGLAKVLGLWTAARAAISTVASGIAIAATMKTINAANAKYQGVPLTPAVLADMVVRNILPDSTGHASPAPPGWPAPLMSGIDGNSPTAEAALSGLSGDRFAALALDTGESYGIIDALRMWNRGRKMVALVPSPQYSTGVPIYNAGENLATTYGITQAELDKVVAYSRVRDEFIPDLMKLAKNTLSPADAVELAVKQIVSPDVAQSLFEAAGGVAEQFSALVDAAGDSAGVEKISELLAHGAITEGQARQAIGMSRLNPRFYYLAMPDAAGDIALNKKWLPIYEIRVAVETGLISTETALAWMTADGYDAQQAQLFLAASALGSLQNPKAESMAVILSEYSSAMLTEAEATKALTDLGYLPAAVPYLLSYAQSKATLAARNTVVSRVRAGYLLSLVDEATARADLDKVGVPAPAAQVLIEDWTVERSVPHTALSMAQIGKLVKEGVMDVATGSRYWAMRGYTAGDIEWLLKLYPPPAPA